jgi:tetratricopeptide (TPR) repeat protein
MKFSQLLIFALLLALAFPIFAQSEREKGIEFYKKAEYDSAVKYLEWATKANKTDADAWNLLGMSYLGISKYKESRKALEQAVKQKPQSAEFKVNLAYANLLSNRLSQAEKEIKKAVTLDSKNAMAYYISGIVFLQRGKFDKAIAEVEQSLNLDKTLQVAYLLKSNAYLYKFGESYGKNGNSAENLVSLQKSIDALEDCLANCPRNSSLVTNPTKLEELKTFHQYFSKRTFEIANLTPAAPQPDDPTVTPLEILSKPRANYTDSARQAGVQGTITLAVLFSADGKTKMILVIKPLSNGLTEEGIKAAKQITFKPQMKDGKPVSVVKMVQYSFTLY